MSFANNKRLADADAQTIRIAAMDLQAMREHSRRELVQKLLDKGAAAELAAEAVQRLGDENLQSDRRFVESLLNTCIRKGRGYLRFMRDVGQHAIDAEVCEQVLQACAPDWDALARTVYKKKYGDSAVNDYNERARRMRFLQSRGFSAEQIQSALSWSASN